ncbi:hypothetical protein BME42_05190 [Klebsiella pneumoniae]|nr:hypothetical protein BME42_05190 [Klebsiella pneumoniae]
MEYYLLSLKLTDIFFYREYHYLISAMIYYGMYLNVLLNSPTFIRFIEQVPFYGDSTVMLQKNISMLVTLYNWLSQELNTNLNMSVLYIKDFTILIKIKIC